MMIEFQKMLTFSFNLSGLADKQAWWTYYANRTRADGDGRPVALTVWKAKRAVIRNFRIESPPFWANAVAESTDITYDGMFVNATNTDPRLSATGLKYVPLFISLHWSS